jgi:hypothetical protein
VDQDTASSAMVHNRMKMADHSSGFDLVLVRKALQHQPNLN